MSDIPGSFKTIKSHFGKDKKRDGIKVSNFLVTLNTNARFDATDKALEALSEPLNNMAEVLFGSSDSLRKVVLFGSRGPRGPDSKFKFVKGGPGWGPETVESFDVTAGVEIGHNARGRRLHVHVAVKIRHHSYIRLDKDRILSDANAYLASVNFAYPIKHLNIRVTPPSAEDYIDK
jgi:hypothetical protein